MTRIILVMAMILIASCSGERRETRQPKVSDAQMRDFRAARPELSQRCLDEVRYGGFEAWEPDDPDCYEMTSTQRWSGLWARGFEWSNFCPDPAKTCPIYGEPGVSSLRFADGVLPAGERPDGLYRIEFVGRRTKVPGHFGHLDQYDHLMIVDKLIALHRLPTPAGHTQQ